MKFTFQKGHFYDQITHLFSSFLRHRPPLMLLLVGVLLWGGGLSYGQNPTVTTKLSNSTRPISSYVIGACRNHVQDEATNGSIFDYQSRINLYKNVQPRFGRKLYRLGGTPIDGGAAYEGYLWNGANTYGTGPYPYDDFGYFLDEAAAIDADMIVGINVGSGSIDNAKAMLDEIDKRNLWDKVAYFELGNELYGDWQFGHNEYACSVERYRDRAAYFIQEMEQLYPQKEKHFAVMGSYNAGWGTYPSIMQIQKNNATTYTLVVNPSYPWSPYTNITYYEWHYTLNNQKIEKETQTSTVTLPSGATNVTVITHSPGEWAGSETLRTASFDENCSGWGGNTSGCYEILDKYFAENSPLMENDSPIFDFIAFHNYPQPGDLFPSSVASQSDAFKYVMSVNAWSVEKLKTGLDLAHSYGVKLVNTEYGSIHIVGEPAKLSHSISEGLFAADNILTAINYDMPSAIAFCLFHTGNPDHSDNLFFPINDDGSPFPVFYAQELIAKNIGQDLILNTTVENPATLTSPGGVEYNKFGVAVTRDPDGTVRVLILNRDDINIQSNISFAIDGITNDYTAELISYSASSVDEAPVPTLASNGAALFTTTPININLDPQTQSFSVPIKKLSINVLVLHPYVDCSTCNDYTITNSTTWDAQNMPNLPLGEVTVKAGGHLTIAHGVDLSFCETGRLSIIGGSVDLYGTLTSCDQEWRGVSVEAGGRFTGNNGTIEHARVGISGTSLSFIDSPYGARINCTNTHFKNNATGVAFAYTFWPMTSGSGGLALNQAGFSNLRLTNCDFDVTNNPNFNNHVELYRSANTVIKGCDFAYSQSSGRNTASRGILAVNSQFRVSASSSMKPSTFSDLAKGVEVIQMSRSSYILEDSQFDRCAVGVHNIGTTGGKILRNTFNMGEMDGAYYDNGEDRQIGVSYEGGTNGITLEENTFIGTTNWNTTTYGTTCRMLAPQDANVIRNNTFTDMAYANWAEENNGNADVGLHYLCNTHTNPALRGWNFIANDPDQGGRAMRLNQGLSLGQTGEYAPARNIFSHVMPDDSGGEDNLRDFWVKDGTGADYKYYYLKNALLEKPLYANVDKKDINDNSGNTCPRPYKEFGTHLVEKDKDEIRQRYFTHRKSYDESKHTYEQLKNSGSGSDVELAQKTMAYHRQQMDAAAYDGYVYALSDTTVTLDTIRLWMRRFANKTGDYMLAADYLTTQEYEMSRRVLASMQQKYDFSAKEMDDYDKMEFMFDELIKASGKPLSEGVLDKMESIATTKEGQASYFAREILSSDYGYFYRPVLSTLPKQYVENGASEGSGYTGPKMMVSPNPTDYQVHFDWSAFATSGKEVVIEVTNQTGGLIEVLKPAPNSTGMDWTTEKVSGNFCYYRLIVNGQEVYGGHIVINK